MSITIGIFDLFSVTIPGLFFFFVIYELFELIGWKFIDLSQLTGFPQIVIVIILAYVIGHVLSYFNYKIWQLLQKRNSPSKKALNKVIRSCPEIEINFKEEQWSILWGILRQVKYESTYTLEKYKADAIMMRNLSLTFFLLMLVEIAEMILKGFDWPHFLLLLVALIFTVVTFWRANRFDYWHYRAIFAEALVYGTSLAEILKNVRTQAKVDEATVERKPNKKGK